MKEKQLQEIEARRNATTLGKWLLFAKGTTIEVQVKDAAPVVSWSGFDDCSRALAEHFANAKFIVCAHNNDIDALLHEVRRLRAVVENAIELNNKLHGMYRVTQILEECLREDGSDATAGK